MADTYVGTTFVADELLTSTKMNSLAADIENLHNGTALGDGIIVTRHLGSSASLQIPAGNIDFSTFAKYVDYEPTVGGFSTPPPGAIYRYMQIGKHVALNFAMPANGTSNSTSFTVSLPVQAADVNDDHKWLALAMQPINNGEINTSNPGFGIIDNDGTVLNFQRNSSGNTWTASGGKRIPYFQMIYEAKTADIT